MFKSVTLSLALLSILVGYQNCGKQSALKANFLKKNKNSENSFFVVNPSIGNPSEPSTQQIDISEYNDENYLAVARSAISAYENQVSSNFFKSIANSFTAYAQGGLTCGAVITSNTNISGALDCSNYSGSYALIVYGSNTKLNGGNSKLKIIFPQGAVGILVYGNSAEVKNVEVSGMTNGMGILIYDSAKGKVTESIANNNLIGITAYAENIQSMDQIDIKDNTATGNGLFGIRVNSAWSSNKKVVNPTIDDNDLSNSGYFALHVRTDNLTFDGSHNVNIVTGSQNGWYLTGGNFQFNNTNLNSSSTSVQKTQIFVAEANQISLSSIQLAGGGGNALQEAYGLHAYKVSNVNVNNSGIQNYNVGIKVATDGGVTSNINVSAGSISNNTFAGIIVQGYDNTQLCPNINNVSYSNNTVYNLWRVPGGNFCN